jgi:uncharacterized protein (DUF697 family)
MGVCFARYVKLGSRSRNRAPRNNCKPRNVRLETTMTNITNEYTSSLDDELAEALSDEDSSRDEESGRSTDASKEAAEQTIGHKRTAARSVILAFAAASAAATVLPLPIKDAAMLSPIELAEVNALAQIYDIPQEESIRGIIDSIMQLGVVSVAARGALGLLERGPRLLAAKHVRSALIAATIVAGVGLSTTFVFEQVHDGTRSLDDLGIYRKVHQSEAWQKLTAQVADALQGVLGDDVTEGLKVSFSEIAKMFVPVA